jgi:hypothetical protein
MVSGTQHPSGILASPQTWSAAFSGQKTQAPAYPRLNFMRKAGENFSPGIGRRAFDKVITADLDSFLVLMMDKS